MKPSWTTEVKVGLVTLVAVGALLLVTFSVGKLQFLIGGKGKTVTAVFDTAAGLEKRALVKQAGVDIGLVEEIVLSADGQAHVKVHLQPGIEVRQDAQASIRSPGFLGDKYLDIGPGSPEAPYLPSGAFLAESGQTADLDVLLARVNGIAKDLQDFSRSLRNVLGTPEGEQNLRETLEHFRSFSAKLDELLAGEPGNRLLTSMGGLEALIADARTLVPEARSMMSSLKGAGESLQTMGTHLSQVGEKMARGEGTIGKLLHDDSLYLQAQTTLKELNDLSRKLNDGQGSLGKLLNDPSLYDEFKAAAAEARQALGKLNQISSKIAKGEGTLGKLVNDSSLYVEAENTLKKVGRAMEGVAEQTPLTTLGTVLGVLF